MTITTRHGTWAAWHREQDGFMAVPPEAFDALRLPWGASLNPVWRRERARAHTIVISRAPRRNSVFYDRPIVIGALYEALGGGFGVVADVLTGDGCRPLADTEFAVADPETVITVRRDPVHGSYSSQDVHPELLELDNQLSELTSSSADDPDRQALLAISRANSNILITGPKSVGKSYSLQLLSRISRLSYIFMRGPDLKAAFDLTKCAMGTPSPYVVVLDDIDEIDLGEAKPCLDAIFSNAIIISVMAVATSSQSLPAFFRKRFGRVVQVGAPGFAQRQRIIQATLHESAESADLAAFVASSTPGYTLSGLNNLCRRAKTSAAMLGEPVARSHFEGLLGTRTKPQPKFAGYEDTVRRFYAIKHQWRQHERGPHGVLVTGVLVYGPSGCGKTLLIQSALSQDLSLNYVSLNAASIYSKYLGDSEARVRQTFLEAKRRAPCVVFIDDIDGISGNRNFDDHSDSGVKNRVLSTFLNELDGVSGRDGVYVVAATNRIDRIDSALLRPGRFDVHLHIGLPSRSDRLAIARASLESMKTDADIDLDEIAALEMTGADIHSVFQRAGLIALTRDRSAPRVTAVDFHLAVQEWITRNSAASGTSNK